MNLTNFNIDIVLLSALIFSVRVCLCVSVANILSALSAFSGVKLCTNHKLPAFFIPEADFLVFHPDTQSDQL